MALHHAGLPCLRREGVHPGTTFSFEAHSRGKRRALLFSLPGAGREGWTDFSPGWSRDLPPSCTLWHWEQVSA